MTIGVAAMFGVVLCLGVVYCADKWNVNIAEAYDNIPQGYKYHINAPRDEIIPFESSLHYHVAEKGNTNYVVDTVHSGPFASLIREDHSFDLEKLSFFLDRDSISSVAR